MATLNNQRESECDVVKGQWRQSSTQKSLTHEDPRCWLVADGVPRGKIDKKLTKFVLDLYKQKGSRSNKQKSNLNHKNKVLLSINHFPDLSQFIDPGPFE